MTPKTHFGVLDESTRHSKKAPRRQRRGGAQWGSRHPSPLLHDAHCPRMAVHGHGPARRSPPQGPPPAHSRVGAKAGGGGGCRTNGVGAEGTSPRVMPMGTRHSGQSTPQSFYRRWGL